jgi:hypothetical protein
MIERRSGIDRRVVARGPERRRGRPPVADPMIVVSVRVPQSVFDARCHEARARRVELAVLLRERLSVHIKSQTA